MNTTSTITKDYARELLQKYLINQRGIMPIYDANIMIRNEVDNTFVISEYTFRHLLKVAYDLTDIKLTGL
jgi:hypothetical protein